jgi:hypothetical protein
LHTGRLETIEKVLDFYRHTSLLARAGKLRNADPALGAISMMPTTRWISRIPALAERRLRLNVGKALADGPLNRVTSATADALVVNLNLERNGLR